MKLSASKNICKLYLLVTVCLWHTNSSAAEAAHSVNAASHPDGMTQAELKKLLASKGGIGNLLELHRMAAERASERNKTFWCLLRDSAMGPEELGAYRDLVNIVGEEGISPLYYLASQSSNQANDKIDWLIKQGADVESVNVGGGHTTPIVNAITVKNESAVKLLLAAGAQKNKMVKMLISIKWCPKITEIIKDAEFDRKRKWQGEGGLRAAWFQATVGVAIDAAVPVMPGAGAGANREYLK